MAKNLLRIAFTAIVFLGFVRLASAQASAGCSPGGLTDPLCGLTLPAAVQKITNLLLVIAAPIASIMVLYGGFQMMTAAGDPEKFSKGRKTLLYAAIGFLVVLLAGQVVNIIKAIFK